MSGYFTQAQVDQLLRPINEKRVTIRDGMSHVEAYDVRAHLTRCLGFGRWSGDLLSVDLLFETVGPHPRYADRGEVVSVGYRAMYRLTVCAPDGTVLATYTEAATGDASNFPVVKRADAHDFAIKTAESQALKRCATNLADQFGLSLYAKGSTAALVKGTLHYPFGDQAPPAASVDAHITEQLPTEDESVAPAAQVSPSQQDKVAELRAGIDKIQGRGKAS